MRLLAAVLLLIGDTPEQTFNDVKKAAADKDVGALFDALAPSDRNTLEQDWQKNLDKAAQAGELKRIAEMMGVTEAEIKKMSARDLMARMGKKAAEQDPKSFDKEFAKFRDGTIASSKVDGDSCVLKVKVGEREEEVELVREVGKWYLSMAPERRKSSERNASARLKSLASAEADFRANDRDADGVNNFWVKDVAGLYGLEIKGEALKLIMIEIAQADRTPGKGNYPGVTEEKGGPGYSFSALKNYFENGKQVPYDSGKGRNERRFGFVAYPSQYPQSGKKTFILCEQNVLYAKDTGGKPVETFPEDPVKDGWKSLD